MIKTFIFSILFIVIGITAGFAEEAPPSEEIKAPSCQQANYPFEKFSPPYQGRGCTEAEAKQKVGNQLLDVCISSKNIVNCVETASCTEGGMCTLYVLWDPVNEPNCGPAVVSSCPNKRGYVCEYLKKPKSMNTQCICSCIL